MDSEEPILWANTRGPAARGRRACTLCYPEGGLAEQWFAPEQFGGEIGRQYALPARLRATSGGTCRRAEPFVFHAPRRRLHRARRERAGFRGPGHQRHRL